MIKSAPTIVLVHSAWADGSSWNKVILLLQVKGLPVIAVQIPLTSIEDDVAATKRIIADTEGLSSSSVIALVVWPSLRQATTRRWRHLFMCPPSHRHR
jgi:hypothetical protein